jgi:hypothetical protein
MWEAARHAQAEFDRGLGRMGERDVSWFHVLLEPRESTQTSFRKSPLLDEPPKKNACDFESEVQVAAQ